MKPPLVLAHQGCHAHEKPNTLGAFMAAAELGADGIELDVRLTSDGEVVVHHDPLVEGATAICDMPLATLPPWIPSLRAVLDACPTGLVNIEIKHSPAEPGYDPAEPLATAVADCLGRWAEEGGELGRIVVSSFWAPSLRAFRETGVSAEIALLVVAPPDRLNRYGGLHPHHSVVSEDLVARARQLGTALRPWTVDDRGRMAELADVGVDAIITNEVAACLEVLGRL